MKQKKHFNIEFQGKTYKLDTYGRDIENILQAVSIENFDRPIDEIDEIDIELFFEKYFVAEVTPERLCNIIKAEYERRIQPLQAITDPEMKEFAIDAYADSFLRTNPTMYREGSLAETADDYLNNNFRFVNIYNEDADEEFSFIADFKPATFDIMQYFDFFLAPTTMEEKAIQMCRK